MRFATPRKRGSATRVAVATCVLAVAITGTCPRRLPGQLPSPANPRLDVGSFTIFVRGERAGREQFSLQRTSATDGSVFELRTESAIAGRRSAVRLETDSAGTPVRYAVEQREGAVVSRRLGGQRVRGRFATLARGIQGEAAREYLLAPGAIVLEAEGVHQYTWLVRGRAPTAAVDASVPILVPLDNRQSVVRLTREASMDTVTIAGARVPAARWRVSLDGETRTFWTDADGRVLRLVIPNRGYEAIRDDLPRD